MYIGGKLLFADHIFNGYGNARKDFLKQVDFGIDLLLLIIVDIHQLSSFQRLQRQEKITCRACSYHRISASTRRRADLARELHGVVR
jgi:hypothetical protein